MLVPESRYGVLCPYEMNPTEITFHNTYNDAPAINERNNVANNSTGTSFHIAVDDKEAIQLIPLTETHGMLEMVLTEEGIVIVLGLKFVTL